MTIDLNWLADPVGREERLMVGATVLRLAHAIEQLVAGIRESGPGEGSRAAIDLDSPVNHETSDGSTHVAHAQSAARTACLAGADHLRAFVIGVRYGRTTVSNWTIARGALEAFARANYLLGSADADQMLGRTVALIRGEMKYASKFGYVYTRDGEQLDVDGYVADLKAMLAEAGIELPKESESSTTTLTSELIETTAPGAGGRLRYSQLSAAAHGESAGVQMFMDPALGTLTTSRVLVVEIAHVLAGCTLALGKLLVEYFNPSPGAVDRWNWARDLASAALVTHAGVTVDQDGNLVFPDETGAQGGK